MADKETLAPNFIDPAIELIKKEAEAVLLQCKHIDTPFAQACQQILDCTGKMVVIGLGKSGHVAAKIAATLASTGTPAFFVHATEALHGDLGMISSQDIVLAISNSGETQEVLQLLPAVARKNIPIIALTGNPESTLARKAHTHLNAHVPSEACPLGLAPTSSTTAAMVMGDALAVALLQARGFDHNDFARSHPHGQLGRRLTITVDDLMTRGEQIPSVHPEQSFEDVILEMTTKHLGMTTVIDDQGRVCGIITDGDLRRHWSMPRAEDDRTSHVTARDIMQPHVKTIHKTNLAIDALQQMQNEKITQLLILSDEGQCEGVLHIHHLLASEIA